MTQTENKFDKLHSDIADVLEEATKAADRTKYIQEHISDIEDWMKAKENSTSNIFWLTAFNAVILAIITVKVFFFA